MTLETWIAYAIATEILLIVPGPTVLLIVGFALTRGRRAAFAAVAGSCLAIVICFAAAFAGLGALLQTSATAYTIVKWAGACYLFWLGFKMLRARPEAMLVADARREADAIGGGWRNSTFLHGFVTTTLNPKTIVFLIAFTPLFLDPAQPTLPQAVIMTATFVVLAFLSDGAYALVASGARTAIMRPRTMRWVQRSGGLMLVGAGLWTAASKRVAG